MPRKLSIVCYQLRVGGRIQARPALNLEVMATVDSHWEERLEAHGALDVVCSIADSYRLEAIGRAAAAGFAQADTVLVSWSEEVERASRASRPVEDSLAEPESSV